MFEKNAVVLFGIGCNFYPYVERLERKMKIGYFCDNNPQKWGMRPYGDERACISPSDIPKLNNPIVIILVEKEQNIILIEKQCHELKVQTYRVLEILNGFIDDFRPFKWVEKIQERRIHRFIDVDLSETTACNFHCSYCYVWRRTGFKGTTITSQFSPKVIRKALSIKRLGGQCFINICARGETMLSQNIVQLVFELLDEGHYVSIVTNGTITKNIEKILGFPKKLQKRMFFKISFHYEELMKKNFMVRFWNNVKKIKNSECSYTLEITPHDGIVNKIEDIKNMFFREENGAMPHVSFARDSNKQGLDLLSTYDLDEYYNIWNKFNSKMFELKYEWYGEKINNYCYAGNWSYLLNLYSGDLKACYRKEPIGNIFDSMENGLPLNPIECSCEVPYCFNSHAFLAWGCVPEISCASYGDMRDRTSKNGEHWVKPNARYAMEQKLYNNNFNNVIRWKDYDSLFKQNRMPAVILFNSPDYSNLGDHAIALAEKNFFDKYFPDYSFIEVSCEEYEKENLKIKNVILKEDIIIISGGGNIGSLWLWIEDMTRDIISSFTENLIFIFPQTIYFENTIFGTKERNTTISVYNGHKKLCIAAREKKTYEIVNNVFGTHIKKVLVPDIAFELRIRGNEKREGALLCFRDDKESLKISLDTVNKILNNMNIETEKISTTNQEVMLDNREEHVKNIIWEISKAEVVVTDRLHCMIFCAISKTPCVVFDNISGKVFGVYKWIEECDFIEKCENIMMLEEKINKVRLSPGYGYEQTIKKIDLEFESFAQLIRSEVNKEKV